MGRKNTGIREGDEYKAGRSRWEKRKAFDVLYRVVCEWKGGG